MKSQSLFLRVPVIVFAVLVGSIYVYARSGGRFFTTPAKVTPTVNDDPNAVSNSLMMGSKSAPAFLPEDPPPAQPGSEYGQPRAPTAGEPGNQPTLLPGSKSERVVFPESVTVPTPTTPAPIAPPQTTSPENPRTLLPGSKSAAVVGPPPAVPPTNNLPTPTPTVPRLLPGSKSVILADPPNLIPPTNQTVQPKAPAQQQQRAQPIQRAPVQLPATNRGIER